MRVHAEPILVYDHNVPAVLKAYIDHIVRKGMTLGFSGEGLLHDKACTSRCVLADIRL